MNDLQQQQQCSAVLSSISVQDKAVQLERSEVKWIKVRRVEAFLHQCAR